MRPSLSSLKVFVIAARATSFTRAAEWLHVTQGAVSQQIAKLEDILGVPLFERRGRALRLTTAGQRLLRGIEGSIDRIDAEVDAVLAHRDAQMLCISAFGSFAAKWLVPRLEQFETEHPHIRVRCETTTRLVDYVAEGIDIGFRFGAGHWAGLHAEKLLEHRIYPVATPAQLDTLDLARGPRCLADTSLYFDLETPTEWRRWFARCGCGDVEPRLDKGFSDTLVMLSALVAGGRGVALVGDHLTQRELERGELVRVFEEYIEPEGAYHLTYSVQAPLSPAAREFREWVLGRR